MGSLVQSLTRWSVAFTLVTVALLTACGNGAQGNRSGSVQGPGGTATVRIRGDWGVLDLTDVQGTVQTSMILTALYDRLLTVDSSGKLIPYLARSWTATSTKFVFNLRSDATCSDGTPVSATIVQNSLQAYMKFNPSGPRAFGPGPWTFTADDANHTLTMTTATPFNDAIYAFADPSTGIVCPAGLVNSKVDQPNKAFGSGPFVLESVSHGDSLVVKGRPDWKWGPNGTSAKTPGFPQQIVYKVVANETTAANLVLTGGVDIAPIQGSEVSRLKADKSLIYQTRHSYYAGPMLINQLPGHPAQDISVRKAIITAFDPQAWNQAAYNGGGTLTTSFVTRDGQCYDPATEKLAPKPSVTAARQILKDAGYTLGADGKFTKNGQPLALTVLTINTLGSAPEYLAQVLESAGFTVTLNNADALTFPTDQRKANFDVSLQSNLTSAVPTMTLAFPYFIGGKLTVNGGTSYGTVDDPQANSLLAAAQRANTITDKCKFLDQLQELVWRKWYGMPVVAPPSDWFAKGWNLDPSTTIVEAWTMTRRASA